MSSPYKAKITVSLPVRWLQQRAILETMTIYKSSSFDKDKAQADIDRFVAERWEGEWETEWKDIVAEGFLASRSELLHEGRDLHLLNYYDTTDPLKNHTGSTTYTLADGDTALMFKLAYTGD